MLCFREGSVLEPGSQACLVAMRSAGDGVGRRRERFCSKRGTAFPGKKVVCRFAGDGPRHGQDARRDGPLAAKESWCAGCFRSKGGRRAAPRHGPDLGDRPRFSQSPLPECEPTHIRGVPVRGSDRQEWRHTVVLSGEPEQFPLEGDYRRPREPDGEQVARRAQRRTLARARSRRPTRASRRNVARRGCHVSRASLSALVRVISGAESEGAYQLRRGRVGGRNPG